MMIFFFVFGLTVLLLYIYWICTRNLNYWKSRNVAGPEPLPFFGNIKETVQRKRHISQVWKDIYNEYKDKKVIGVYRMTSPSLLLVDLDLIQDVMVKNFDAFGDRGLEFGDLGENIFTADLDTWRVLRNKFSPMFSSGKLKGMFHLMEEQSESFMDHLNSASAQIVEHEIKTILRRYTISTISACAFGMDINLWDGERMSALARIDKLIFTATYFTEVDFLFPGILKKINRSLLPPEVNNFFLDLVRTVFAQRNGKPSGRKDFMDQILELIQAGEVPTKDNKEKTIRITESVTAAQAFAFFAAGYDTSASTMAFLLYYLAMNQSIQDKVIAEVDEVIARYGGKVTFEALSEMPYLTRVFEETMRMHPIGDTLQRCAKRNYQLPGTNVTVPKGQIVLIPVLAIHRDERYFSNPEVFDPDRFLPEKLDDIPPCAYLPFGAGPRHCIGMHFGKIQSSLCIARLMSEYRVQPSARTPKKIQISANRIVYGPEDGLFLDFVRRRESSTAPKTDYS